MAAKVVNTRIQLKCDTEANWIHSALRKDGGDKETGTTFVPLKGELIIYSPDDNGSPPYFRLKVGDGVTSVPNLEFIDAGTINGEKGGIVMKNNFDSFPSPGSPDKLYIDLSSNQIYHYTNDNGYIQIANYTTQTTPMKKITDWDAGSATTVEVNNNILKIINGSAPSLSLSNDIDVVTSLV